MMTSDQCWLKSICKKGLNPNSECNTCDSYFCIKLYKLTELYDKALIPQSKRKPFKLRIDADETDKDKFMLLKTIENEIQDFVDDGANLYIYSNNCGNGKTSWAIRLVQSYLNRIWITSELTCRALYVCVPQFLLALKDNITERNDYVNYILKHVNSADLVIWDDVATKSFTEFERERLFALINDRLIQNKSNIFTSNLSPTDLDTLVGARLYSRIVNSSMCIELRGKDKRGI